MEEEGVGAGQEGQEASASGAAGLPQHADLWVCEQGGVQRVFVDHPLFASPDIYGGTAGGGKGVYTYLEAGEHPDLELRYSVLCQAALAAPVLLEQQQRQAAGQEGAGSRDPPPQQEQQQPIIYIANDWPTALLLLRLQYTVRAAASTAGGTGSSIEGTVADSSNLHRLLVQRLGASAAAAFCIHNLAYQGLLSSSSFPRLSLPPAALPALCTSADWRGVLHHLEGMRSGGGLSSSSTSSMDAMQCAAPGAQHSQQGRRQQQQQQQQQQQEAAVLPNSAAAAAAAAERGLMAAAATAEEPGAAAAGAPGAPAAAPAEAGCASGQLNQMRSALLAADYLVTVSRGYAAEVQRGGPMACGMHDILAARGISGIMNGIDTVEWDPATDPHLPDMGRYTAATVARGKARMKAWLQERLGLDVNPDAPLIGFVGRLTQQKGVDVLLAAAPALLAGAASTPGPTRWRAPAPAVPAAAEGGRPGTERPSSDVHGSQRGASIAADIGSDPGDGSASESGSSSSGGMGRRGSSGRPAATGGGSLPAAPAPRPAATAHVAAGVSNARRSSHLEVPAGRTAASSQEPGTQLVLLGTGDHWMEAALLGLPQSFPGQAAGLTTFSEELAHWIMAASDFVLVPSRFEPCGLVAQAAARYGAVPIVCAVGGLKDLVTPEIGYTLPGFTLDGTAADHRQDTQQLISVVRRAAAEYGSARYLDMQQRCMALDVSWERPAAEWEQLLQRMAAPATPAGGAAGQQLAA